METTTHWPTFPERYLPNDVACLSDAQAVLALPVVPDAYRARTTDYYGRALVAWGNERGRKVEGWPWRP